MNPNSYDINKMKFDLNLSAYVRVIAFNLVFFEKFCSLFFKRHSPAHAQK